MEKATRKRKNDGTNKKSTKQKCINYLCDADGDEEQLSRILFGGSSTFLQSLEEAERETADIAVDSGIGETDSDGSNQSGRKPAWVDEDDGIDVGFALKSQKRHLPNGGINTTTKQYKALLSHKFTSIVGTPKWAKNRKHSESDDDNTLQTCGFIPKDKPSELLPSNKLEFKKLADLNSETYAEGPHINCIEFHPNSTVSLIAGQSGIATLYAVDGKRNTKLHSVKFEKYPIFSAKFLPNGNEAIIGSRKSHFYTYDLHAAKSLRVNLPHGLTQMKQIAISTDYIAVAGKWGEIHILHLQTKQKLFTLKQTFEVTALTFNNTSSLLYAHSNTGEVTVFDMTARRLIHKFIDDGCLRGTNVAISPSNQFVATSSAEGVVNLYTTHSITQLNHAPQPQKSIFNLQTTISDIKFNNSSELLAISSSDIQNAVKILHVQSKTVFSNFPSTFGNQLGHVNVLNMSPNSGYLALGNTASTVALYRLKHFKNY